MAVLWHWLWNSWLTTQVRILQWATLNDAYLLLGHYIGYDGCRICLSLVKPEFESSQTEPEVSKSKQGKHNSSNVFLIHGRLIPKIYYNHIISLIFNTISMILDIFLIKYSITLSESVCW